MENPLYAMTVYKGQLIIGGSSTVPQDIPSIGWMRWGPVNYYEGDLNCDCCVDGHDLLQFTDQWLNVECRDFNNCGQADLNYDDTVDFADFSKIAPDWMKGTE